MRSSSHATLDRMVSFQLKDLVFARHSTTHHTHKTAQHTGLHEQHTPSPQQQSVVGLLPVIKIITHAATMVSQ